MHLSKNASRGRDYRLWKTCGADRDRTDDIQLAKLALSQLSYSPSSRFIVPRNSEGTRAGGAPRCSPLYSEGKVVGLGGLEPPTSRLSGARSSQLSYRPREAGCAKRERLSSCKNPFFSIQCVKEPRELGPSKPNSKPLTIEEALTWLTLRRLLSPGAPCSTEVVPCARSP